MKRLVLCAFILLVAALLPALAEDVKTPPTVIQTDGTGHQTANILLPHDGAGTPGR